MTNITSAREIKEGVAIASAGMRITCLCRAYIINHADSTSSARLWQGHVYGHGFPEHGGHGGFGRKLLRKHHGKPKVTLLT